MDWTAERIVLLKRLRDDGVSYTAIAAQLGITRGAVSGKIDRLGLAARQPAPRGPRKPRAVLKLRRVVPQALAPDPGVLEARGASLNPRTGERGQPADPSRPTPDWAPVARTEDGPVDGGRDSAVDPPVRTSRACSLLELTEDTCRWPIGDVGEPGFYFCGEPPLEGAPYCGPHCRKAFRPLDAKPLSEFLPDRDAARVLQPDIRFGQFAHWDVT